MRLFRKAVPQKKSAENLTRAAGKTEKTFTGVPNKNWRTYAIPQGFEKIGDCAFSRCNKLTGINIPAGVKSIGRGAFYECEELTSVGSIGDNAFSWCENLISINMPDGVTSIGKCVFYGCKSLTDITMPNSITNIGKLVFYGCKNLTVTVSETTYKRLGGANKFKGAKKVNIVEDREIKNNLNIKKLQEDTSNIGDGIFAWYKKLTSGIAIPNSVKIKSKSKKKVNTIEDGKFKDKNKVNIINDGNFKKDIKKTQNKSLYLSRDEKTVTGVKNENERSYTIPEGVESIGRSVFFKCKKLTYVTIPGSVKSIGSAAFFGCKKLAAITSPKALKVLGKAHFTSAQN